MQQLGVTEVVGVDPEKNVNVIRSWYSTAHAAIAGPCLRRADGGTPSMMARIENRSATLPPMVSAVPGATPKLETVVSGPGMARIILPMSVPGSSHDRLQIVGGTVGAGLGVLDERLLALGADDGQIHSRLHLARYADPHPARGVCAIVGLVSAPARPQYTPW